MAVLQTGQSFSSGDQVTATKLQDIANLATFRTGTNQTADDSTIQVDGSGGYLKVKSAGISSNELATDSVTENKIQDGAVTADKIVDDSITLTKIQNFDTAKVLGRTTAGNGNPELVDILNENDMVSDRSDALVTQSSVKAYVESLVPSSVIQLKAKCSFDGTVSSPIASGGFNISGITKSASGDYTVTFTNTITNPIANVTALNPSSSNPVDASIYSISSTSIRIISGTNASGLFDTLIHLTVF